MGHYYTVASVELGNTTTKCIIASTNLKTAEIFEIAKEVRLTRDVREPNADEVVFGQTLLGIKLTRNSVAELVADVLRTAVSKAKLDVEKDLHFAVRSTGVNAGFSSPEEVGEIVKSLAEGCLMAGIPPRKMTAALAPEKLPPGLRDFTWLKKVYFDGAIASVLPPSNTSVVANEMEGELVTAGLKGAAKATDMDVRNPMISLDFGTTLAGRVTDDGYPYAKTVGSFAGLAGAIPDAIARGSGLVQAPYGCFLDLPSSTQVVQKIDGDWLERARRIVRVTVVPSDVSLFGTVPVNPKAAEESDLVLVGVDAGTNGSGLVELEDLGREIHETGGISLLIALADLVQTDIVQRLITLCAESNLVLSDTSLGLTGRAITTGTKPEVISSTLTLPRGELWTENHQMIFVEDGLAMGAAVAARCMNSLGTPSRPMGGRKGDRCIMNERMKVQRG